jgi:hypothetical protein
MGPGPQKFIFHLLSKQLNFISMGEEQGKQKVWENADYDRGGGRITILCNHDGGVPVATSQSSAVGEATSSATSLSVHHHPPFNNHPNLHHLSHPAVPRQ